MENKRTHQDMVINPRDLFIKSPKEAKKPHTRTKVNYTDSFVYKISKEGYN